MVELDGESLNTSFGEVYDKFDDIFDELEDWSECLEEHEFELRRIMGGPKP
jgi:hypothetical protein